MAQSVLLIDNCDFINFPIGGTLSFDRQLLKTFPPSQLALVGITTQNLKIGEWTKIDIDGKSYEFYPIKKVVATNKKPLLPMRLTSFWALRKHLKNIRKKGYADIFTQTPQFLFALKYFKWRSLCFCFAGVGNSVSMSRYRRLRFLGRFYEKRLFITLNKIATCILAAADSNAIEQLSKRSNGILNTNRIKSFPTRFDNNIFNIKNKLECRGKLGLPEKNKILVTVGRLSWVKGWDLLIEAYKLRNDPDCILIFVGDGEDRNKIESSAKYLIDSGSIRITGYVSPTQVANYLNAADLVLVGSYEEGWSTTMVEALACGKAIVATDVSSSKDLIKPGLNGFIIHERDPTVFNNAISKGLELNNNMKYSIEISKKYSVDKLYEELQNEWPELKQLR
jgi:glycosyltransferase involved in cell wall biosynthesis